MSIKDDKYFISFPLYTFFITTNVFTKGASKKEKKKKKNQQHQRQFFVPEVSQTEVSQ